MALSDAKVGPAIAVSDMGQATDYYENTLGLSAGRDAGDGGRDYPCGGGSELHIYPNPDGAGKSPATIAAFQVADLEAEVAELSGKGVSFEQYGDPLNTDDRGIADLDEGRGAWFKDPDGNILGVWQPR
jgi:catechol-2,3-dioxygenase